MTSLLHLRNSYCMLMIMLIAIFSCRGETQPRDDDLQSLKALRDSFMEITRSGEVVVSSWDMMNWPCNWTGIQCDGLKVSKLDTPCSLSPLDIPFPPLLAEFKSLTHLNLSSCGFTGEISPQFWNLENLEVLDLSRNSLFGQLPSSIGNMKRLRLLILDSNRFSGKLPREIGDLVEIEELSLQSNRFSGALPVEIGNLRLMKSLDIRNNTFSGNLPSSLANVTQLEFLSVHQNIFSGVLFKEIGELRSLKLLDLSWNFLSGDIPSSVGNLVELLMLDLKHCRFTGAFPEHVSLLRNLSYFNLAYNDFNGELPASIGKLGNLVYFIASNSGLRGAIPSEIANCTKLETLDLSFNSFSGVLPYRLAGLSSIKSVILNSNRLSGPLPEWISNWKHVYNIELAENLFTGSIPPLNLPALQRFDVGTNMLSGKLSRDICNAPLLKYLVLLRNNFSGSIDISFKNCSSLTDLILSENSISGELPAYLGRLQLSTLDLAKNRLTGLIPDQIWESETLQEISLNGNFLRGSLSDAVSKATNLHRLQLDDNLLTGRIPTSIGKLANLINLSLHGNQLNGEIPSEMFECTMLVSLDLGSNRLTGNIPKSISQLKFLDNLVLSDNLLSGFIPEEICSGFQKAASFPDSEYTQHYGMLDLSNNQIEGSFPSTIQNCIVVKEIQLQGNKLNGSIPEGIWSLPNLTLLDLSFNSFSGLVVPNEPFSSISLQGLILSHNQLRGFIPADIWRELPSLAKLDLSNNCLTGPLPPSLFSVKSLAYLDVSMNSLSGRLTAETKSSLVVLNASNNQFTGSLDDGSVFNLASISMLDLHNNAFYGSLPASLSSLDGLTYLDLSENHFQDSFPCNICSIQGLRFTNFSQNKFTGNYPNSCKDETGKPICLLSNSHDFHSSVTRSRASLFGVATIAAAVIILIMLLGFLKWESTHRRQEVIILGDATSRVLMPTPEPTSTQGLLGKKKKKKKEHLSINMATFEHSHSLLRVKASDISTATENFSSSYIIGDGGFGTVYRAKLTGGLTIAVKRLNGGHKHGEREFLAELETIGKVRHENLVALLGYCVLADEKFLIYEYMEQGSLESWLKKHALDWQTRFKICVGAARGIAYLHHGFVPHVIHRDIKSSNILLDTNFEPRVSDFGLARIISACDSHISTVLAGTLGYIPPEYGQAMLATTKGDVYSFGVVMLELVTGRAPTGQADGEGGNLVGWVRLMVAKGKDYEVLDPCLSCVAASKNQMLRVVSIAMSCTKDLPSMRPTMLQVVKQLKKAN